MMKLKTYIVNAFAENIGSGNPAGVVLSQENLSDELMQKIAFDINKSETAFITLNDDKNYTIRWFTPLKEVPMCGHATLAASKVLFESHAELSEIKYRHQNGTITVHQDKEKNIAMLFPLDEYEKSVLEPIYYDFFHLTEIKDCIRGVNTKKVILILDESVDLKKIVPNFQKMKEYAGKCENGMGLTKLSDKYDFETRYFNPWFGVNEDPVTGSVHTVLANYWSKHLNKNNMTAYQNSQRPGELCLTIKNKTTVEIKGKAKIFMAGHIMLD